MMSKFMGIFFFRVSLSDNWVAVDVVVCLLLFQEPHGSVDQQVEAGEQLFLVILLFLPVLPVTDGQAGLRHIQRLVVLHIFWLLGSVVGAAHFFLADGQLLLLPLEPLAAWRSCRCVVTLLRYVHGRAAWC